MNLIQLASIIIGSIVSLGVLIAGAGYGFAQFKVGQKKATKDDFELFNAQIEALQKLCKDQQDQINVLQADIKAHTSEIGRLNGINEEKEKKITELTEIIAGRDPQLTEFIKKSVADNIILIQGVATIINLLGGAK